MPKRKKLALKPKKALDTISGKRGRGRPGVRASEIRGRADNYRLRFRQIWNDLADAQGVPLKGVGNALLKAQTEEEVIRAFDPWPGYQLDFKPIAGLILQVLRESKFPKKPQPQMNFLADSLAGSGSLSARRSRDICEQERNKKVNYIIRQDYYIQCTCGYKGPALYGKCPKCGTDELSLPIPHWGS